MRRLVRRPLMIISFVLMRSPSHCATMLRMTSRELSDEYWFCLKHHRVERYEETDSANRIGPFPTEAEAANALQTISDREKAYDKSDSEWEDDE